jgi:hypothetical protein
MRLLRVVGMLTLGVLLVVGVVAAAQPQGSRGEPSAIAALEMAEGDCFWSAEGLRPPVDERALADQSRTVNGHGRVGHVFFGTSEELARDVNGTVVAAGDSSVWILTKDAAGGRRATAYESFALKDSTAWLAGEILQTHDCSESNP